MSGTGLRDGIVYAETVEEVKTGNSYSGTISFTATGGCRLFCSALPVRSA